VACADHVSRSVGLLISVLVRHPEVCAVGFGSRGQTLRFTFMLRSPEPGRVARIEESLTEAIFALGEVTGRAPAVCRFECSSFDSVMIFALERDVNSLSREEISVITTLIKDEAGAALVLEDTSDFGDEEIAVQDELISEMLEDLPGEAVERNLYAFREGGRVLVFNRWQSEGTMET